MSSTTPDTRGGDGTDLFPTPRSATDAILPKLRPLAGKRILEPCAGDGAIIDALIAAGVDARDVHAVELRPAEADLLVARRPGLGRVICGDFLTCNANCMGRFDLIITNPPFSLAQEVIEHAVSLLAPGGVCVVLVRLAFALSGQKRRAFRRRHPFDLYPLSARPSFSGEWIRRLEARGADMNAVLEPLRRELPKKGRFETVAEVRSRLMGSDSADYGWTAIGDGRGGRFEILEAA